MKNLDLKAWLALVALMLVMGLLIFVSAGTVSYWQGWVYLAIFTTASALTTRYLMQKDRALLERRMSGGPTAEKRPTQKLIMWGASFSFIALLVVPALDYRFEGPTVPRAVTVVGDLLDFSLCLDAQRFVGEHVAAFAGELVLYLDQQPVFSAVPRFSVHFDKAPLSVELCAAQGEMELPGLIALRRVVERFPCPAVPKEDGATAVFALGDDTFKIAVLDGMVFDVNGQSLFAGDERRSLGDRPAQ